MEHSWAPRRPEDYDFEGSKTVWLTRAEWNRELIGAIRDALPGGATIAFNHADDRVWFEVSKPGDTEAVYEQALRTLGRS